MRAVRVPLQRTTQGSNAVKTRWIVLDQVITLRRPGRPVEYTIRHEFREIVVPEDPEKRSKR